MPDCYSLGYVQNFVNESTNFYTNDFFRLLIGGFKRPFYYATKLNCFMSLPKCLKIFVRRFWPFWISSNWISINIYYTHVSFSLAAEWLIPITRLYVLKYVLSMTFFSAQTLSKLVMFQLAAILKTSSRFYFSSMTLIVRMF